MKKKKLIIGLVVILVISVLSILLLVLFGKNETINIIKFNKEYDELKTNSSIFNENRKKIYSDIFNDLVISDIDSRYLEYLEKIKEYEESLIRIKEDSKYLNEICLNKKIYINELKVKCNSYKISFERANNIFINDINTFNTEIITKYNENTKENKLELYKSGIASKYIDYNEDKTYEGK